MKVFDDPHELDQELLGIAQAFLRRHESHGLASDQVLFCRAVRHLQDLDVPMHVAERLVSHAYGTLKCGHDRRRLDIAMSLVEDGLVIGIVWLATTYGTNARSASREASVIVSAGMWSAQLLGAPFDTLLQVCRQQLYWFRLDEPQHYPARSPSFILHSAGDVDACYGFPPIPGEGSVKIATEQYSVSSQPDSLDRQPSLADAQRLFHELVAPHIAGLAPELVKASVCAYTVTPDSGFIIDRHPRLDNVTVVSACSGHGFKHSAAIGEALAQQLVDGHSTLDLGAFSLARFAAAPGA